MKKQELNRNFWTNFFQVVSLFLLLLLISNVIVVVYAISMNRYVCSRAARAGASVFAGGGNQQDIESAVYQTVNKSDVHNFCVNQPELDELRFYVKYEKGSKQEMLLVKTVTNVRVPAPFLIFMAQHETNGFIRFNSSYAIKLREGHLS